MVFGKILTVSCVAFLAAIPLFLHAKISAELSFSTDGGKTWSRNFPTVKHGSTLDVKAAYSIDESRAVSGALTSELKCNRDFPSANGAMPSYYRLRHEIYWKSPTKADSYVYRLNFLPRRKGVSGVVYNHKNRKFEKRVLPALDASKNGSYIFTLAIGYRLKSGERVDDDQIFYVTITD